MMLLWLAPVGFAVCLGYGAIMYRAGRGVEAARWRAEEAERERALNALAGGPRAGLKIELALRPCVICRQGTPRVRVCDGCTDCIGQHQHIECSGCSWKWIVQPS